MQRRSTAVREPLHGSEPRPATADELFAYIESFTNIERGSYSPRAFRLDRMRALLDELGNPHRGISIIHVAGSKGKGSTCAYIESALLAGGYRVGRYGSPHVSSYLERFSVAGRPAPARAVLRASRPLITAAHHACRSRTHEQWPTTFELLTALAFLLFRDVGLTHAVIEVGLGGRLDATNLVDPIASVISTIELEHTEYLGTTIEAIAAEKAGIIKPNRPVYVQDQAQSVIDVFLRVAAANRSPLHRVSDIVATHNAHPAATGNRVRVTFRNGTPIEFTGRMLGGVQSANVALAAACLTDCFPDLDPATLQSGFEAAALPGRGELFAGPPPVLIDGAHTPTSVRHVADVAEQLHPDADGRILIFGCTSGKRYHEMAAELAPRFPRIIIARPGAFKPSDLPALADAFAAHGVPAQIVENAASALSVATARAGGLVVVTGSFYLMGEVRDTLLADHQRRGASAAP